MLDHDFLLNSVLSKPMAGRPAVGRRFLTSIATQAGHHILRFLVAGCWDCTRNRCDWWVRLVDVDGLVDDWLIGFMIGLVD